MRLICRIVCAMWSVILCEQVWLRKQKTILGQVQLHIVVCVNWKMFQDIPDWSAWLQEGDNPPHIAMFRCNINKKLPWRSDSFVQKLKVLTGQGSC